MSTEYTTVQCFQCGDTVPGNQVHQCRAILTLTEARVRELAREEIRACDPMKWEKVYDARIRDAALEEASQFCDHLSRHDMTPLARDVERNIAAGIRSLKTGAGVAPQTGSDEGRSAWMGVGSFRMSAAEFQTWAERQHAEKLLAERDRDRLRTQLSACEGALDLIAKEVDLASVGRLHGHDIECWSVKVGGGTRIAVALKLAGKLGGERKQG